MLRIIANKRISLTDSEYQLYQEICKSYDTPKQRGSDLFRDLFETNEHGIITFLRPPTKAFTSMEVFLFLVNIMIHQNLGAACEHSDLISAECKAITLEATSTILEARATINEMRALIDELKLNK